MNRKERRIAEKEQRKPQHPVVAAPLSQDVASQLFSQAVQLQQCGKIGEAETILEKLLRAYPDHVGVLNLLGVVKFQKGETQKGEALFERAIALQPGNATAYGNLGTVLNACKRYDEALICYDKAIALQPDYVDAHYNRGVVLQALQCYQEALHSYDNAIRLNPRYERAYFNRGVLFFNQMRFDEALADYDKAIALNPAYVEAYEGKAWIKLLQGNYAEGWELNEWRWKKPGAIANIAVRISGKPLWQGKEPLSGKTILVFVEQGLGDTIQFCRYLPLLERAGAKVILVVPKMLRSLLETLPCRFDIITENQPVPAFDFYCPLMSLPRAFGTTLETIPANIPYLHVDKGKHLRWKERLGVKSRLRVGLVWSGSTTHKNDHNRSILLKQLAPLLECDAEFHCLQKEIRLDDAAMLTQTGMFVHADTLNDFSDTAALVAEMDVVISVDTSVAHLAGALGKQVWVLLPFVPDYRWLLEREDSPWYPTAKLFRQKAAGDWDDVIARVRQQVTLIP